LESNIFQVDFSFLGIFGLGLVLSYEAAEGKTQSRGHLQEYILEWFSPDVSVSYYGDICSSI
jgi:hypothetical protein